MEIIELKCVSNLKMCIPSIESNENVKGVILPNEIRMNHIWSKKESSILVDILSKNKDKEDVVIDVGSHLGYFTLISLAFGHHTIAIEPNPFYKKYIDKSMEMNHFNPKQLEYYENFASSSSNDILFDGWTGNDIMLNQTESLYYVKPISIDKICDKNVIFMKIDVEGAEPSVFQSCQDLIENKKIKYIIFEFNYILKDQVIQEQVDILYYLQSKDYHLFEIIDNIDHLISIPSIEERMNYLIHEYHFNHKVHNPDIIHYQAGTNILAVLNGSEIPSINLFG